MASVYTTNPILRMNADNLLHDLDLTNDELVYLLDLAAEVKRAPRDFGNALAGRSIALLFEKPSLRTRLTFELAAQQMGARSVFCEGPLGPGAREPLEDVARNLDRWVDAIVARVFKHATVQGLAHWASVPVINALCDLYHPCQALADVLTVRERFGNAKGVKLTFVGDGNNVAHSLMLTGVRLGMDFAIACPKGYEPNAEIVAQAEGLAAVSGAAVTVTNDPSEALGGAHAVYTDVCASMGQESEADRRRQIFQPYQVNAKLMEMANSNAIFMHCLPAKRGQEVTAEVIESKQSVVFDQAENRLHAQKALLLMLL